MSYCRFSSDNWKSDMYVYEHCDGGWTTHVAGNRLVGDAPETVWDLLAKGEKGQEEFMRQHKAQMDYVQGGERLDIDLPHAGETFSDSSPGACAERLKGLRALGYHVPQYAIDELEEEASEEG